MTINNSTNSKQKLGTTDSPTFTGITAGSGGVTVNGGNIPFNNSGDRTIANGMGANTLDIADVNSTVNIYGLTPLIIEGDFFPGATSQSVSTGTVTNICSGSTTGIGLDNGLTFGDLGGGQGYGFGFNVTGIYRISYCVSYRPAITGVGVSFTATSAELYFIQNQGSGDTGDRFAYSNNLWQAAGVFPSALVGNGTITITDTSQTFRFVTFQNTGSTQTLGMSSTSRQKSSFSIVRISPT